MCNSLERKKRFLVGAAGRAVSALSALLLAVLCLVWAAAQALQGPPKTRTDNVKETMHGVEVTDPYRWLEDQKSPETRAWIDAQNEYTKSILDPWPGRQQLKNRITEILKIESLTVPVARNGRYFFQKRLADRDLFAIYLREGLLGKKDEVLIDPHTMSPDHSTNVTLMDVSKDGTLMGYGVRQGGEDEVTVNILNVDSRKNLPDQLPKGRYFSLAFKPDKSGFYYARHEPAGTRVYYHKLGSEASEDSELFGKGYGPDKLIFANLSDDGHYLLIHVSYGSAGDKTEVYYQDVLNQGPILPLVNDLPARFQGQVANDHCFLQTNWDAPNGRIFSVDLKNPFRANWREIIKAGEAVIEDFAVAGGKVFVNYLQNVSSRLKIYDPNGRHIRDILFPMMGTVEGISGRWDRDEVFFGFNSYYVPTTLYRYQPSNGKQQIWAQVKTPVDTTKFRVKQARYMSKDGTKVPIFLVYREGIKLDGSNCTLLTGYGGFNLSLTPRYSSSAMLWVDQGGVFAVPNLRGGGEFGEAWHKAGMREKKQNVFDDFIAAAEWLIKNRYTKPAKLALSGGSNGGLLVGAGLTQRPELFQAILCYIPLLDMVRYHKFLVARFWVPEYGSSEDPNQFKYIYKYSPYHNVIAGTKYPAILFISGDSDTRVDPLHARKMTALLQAATGSSKPVLLHYDTKGGHSRAGKAVTQQIEDMTYEFSFLFWQLGA